jgi:hypothetical protein
MIDLEFTAYETRSEAETNGLCSMEWGSFELLVLLSGLLPNPKLEAAVLSIWYV